MLMPICRAPNSNDINSKPDFHTGSRAWSQPDSDYAAAGLDFIFIAAQQRQFQPGKIHHMAVQGRMQQTATDVDLFDPQTA